MKLAIIAITRNGARLATELKNGLGQAEVYVLQKYAGQAGKGAHPFSGELSALVPTLWRDYSGLIFIMATGIVVRLVAPYLEGKDKDPAVVVMDDAGKFAISLLSGHLGGANDLAERCAFVLGARPVITTATDANNLPSFDLLAQHEGWVMDDLSRVKSLNSLLLDGEEIGVVDPTGRVRSYFYGQGKLVFHETYIAALQSSAAGHLFVTNRQLPPQVRSNRLLVLRPRNLVLGIGCNSATSVEEIEAVVMSQLKRLFLSPKSVRSVASAEAKRHEPGLLAFAEQQGVELRFFSSDELNGVSIPSPPSVHAVEAIGAIGVAEPAALLASNGGVLLLKKVKSGNVTLAIAEVSI
ncbi:MAG TPA: cobalt-precorrin 5A hydrolase [Geobacterales bacterium]|nr:cobalt-precorrin 5A hydrolase [Geobacterales bacterium]